MKQGTKSVLFGVHSIIHSIMVLISWIILYKNFPKFWQLICIFIHDIGFWGTDYIDNIEDKNNHWKLGARIGLKLFGKKGYLFCAGHSSRSGYAKSKLYKVDKYSHYIIPKILIMWNHIIEPDLIKKMGISDIRKSADVVKTAMKKNIESGKYESTHKTIFNK